MNSLLKFGNLFFIFSAFALNAFATDTLGSKQYTQEEVITLIKDVSQTIDPETLTQMKTAIQAINANEMEMENYKKMGLNSDIDQRRSIFLTCVVGSGAILLKLQAGICLDSKGNTHILRGLGGGLSAGARGSLLIGLIRTSNNYVSGNYGNFSLGGAGSEATVAIISNPKLLALLKGFTAQKIGLGLDILAGVEGEYPPSGIPTDFKSTLGGNSLFLVGPSFGLMVDVSVGKITID